MFSLPQSSTTDMPLTDVLAQLRAHPVVTGLITVGSTGRDTLTDASDYDIVVVLDAFPLPLHVGITYIDYRLTDVLFANRSHVAQILNATAPLNGDAWEGRVARWLLAGQIVFDRHGELHQAHAKIASGTWIAPHETIDSYGAWIGVNYNLLHTRRLMQSDDPVYLAAGELRIALYGVGSLLLSYFRVRGMLWEGDKAAVRHLMTHDPVYFARLQHLLREPDPQQKMALYEHLAADTLAPLGPLWQGEPTVFWDDVRPTTHDLIAQTLAFWEDLVQGALAR